MNTSPVQTSAEHAFFLLFVWFISCQLKKERVSYIQQLTGSSPSPCGLQGEQLRQTLEEKRLRHSRSLIAAVEEQVSRKLREKDVELDKYKRRNMELEEHVKQLSLEAHLWQTKAKNQETVLHTLRTSVHLSREDLSKEGCGDSEVDDAASSHHDDLADAQARAYRENRELKEQRSCRICRSNEVSILLLPCRHLCLCKDCEGRLDTCPVCGSLKNASVQVYMS